MNDTLGDEEDDYWRSSILDEPEDGPEGWDFRDYEQVIEPGGRSLRELAEEWDECKRTGLGLRWLF